MPPYDQLAAAQATTPPLARLLLYGPGKTKKTWWAARAAEAGFNVHLLDGDKNPGILRMISKEAQARINLIDISDATVAPVMYNFVTKLLRGTPFLWDEQEKEVRLTTVTKSLQDDRHFYWIDPRNLNWRDVLVIDSWTALSNK